MSETQPDNGMEHAGDPSSELLFGYIVDKIGLDVVVGALKRRSEVTARKLEGSILDHKQTDTQLTVRADRIEFVTPADEPGENWQGTITYDAARHALNTYINEQLHDPTPPGPNDH